MWTRGWRAIWLTDTGDGGAPGSQLLGALRRMNEKLSG